MPSNDPQNIVIEHEDELYAIPTDTVRLILGSASSRRSHDVSRTKALMLRGEQMATIILSLQELTDVVCRSVRWNTIILPPLSSSCAVSYLYAIQEVWPPAGPRTVGNDLVGRKLVVLPANPYSAESEIDRAGQLRPQLRVVQVSSVPVTLPIVFPMPRLLGLGDPSAFRELVVDVRSRQAVPVAGCVLAVVGQFVVDLSVRWSCSPDMLNTPAEVLQHLSGVTFCTSLQSLTLSYNFVAGRTTAETQLSIITGLLRNVPSISLQRIQFRVYVHEIEGSDIMEQVKQTPWQHLKAMLNRGRFHGLREVVIVVKGADKPLCDDIWQEMEKYLRFPRESGVQLIRSDFCII